MLQAAPMKEIQKERDNTVPRCLDVVCAGVSNERLEDGIVHIRHVHHNTLN